jgi:hypothetical protein
VPAQIALPVPLRLLLNSTASTRQILKTQMELANKAQMADSRMNGMPATIPEGRLNKSGKNCQ